MYLLSHYQVEWLVENGYNGWMTWSIDFDDFNKVYKAELAKPYPVRSAFGVAELAAGASVEVECTAAK